MRHGGISDHPNYNIWAGMHARCCDPGHRSFAEYGGSGVKVCERWSDFAAFVEDMGTRPSSKHSLDRYPNPKGNYEPGNCRWATPAQQNRNKSNNVWVEFNGVRMVASDWDANYGHRRGIVRGRIKRGWPVESAITTPSVRRANIADFWRSIDWEKQTSELVKETGRPSPTICYWRAKLGKQPAKRGMWMKSRSKEILQTANWPLRTTAIARQFGVSHSLVSQIRKQHLKAA